MSATYDTYRQPRLRWLPPLPAHWVEQRAKTFYLEVDERSRTGQEELLSVSHLTGVTPRSQKKVTMFRAASYVGAKLARPDDIVINTLWAWMAALGTRVCHQLPGLRRWCWIEATDEDRWNADTR